MSSTVVVGIDGRPGGWDALALAQAIAPGASLVLVTAYTFETFRAPAAPDEDLADQIREGAQRLLADAVAERAPGAATRIVPFAAPGRALQEAARDEGADLVVVGSTHRSGLGRVLAGDDALAAVRDAPCAVAVAPRGFADVPVAPERIVVGFDGGDPSRAALDAAVGLGRGLGAPVHVVIAVPPFNAVAMTYAYGVDWGDLADRERTSAEGLLERTVADLEGVDGEVVDGGAPDVLSAAAGERDLLVVGSRGWGAVRRLVLGSTGEALIRRAPCAVMVVPRPDEADRGR